MRNTQEDQFYKCTNIIEDDSFFGNSDKLVFCAKELKASVHPDKVAESNPLLIGKLDPNSIENFNFPRMKHKLEHKEG